jgi:hypothetical protein
MKSAAPEDQARYSSMVPLTFSTLAQIVGDNRWGRIDYWDRNDLHCNYI